MTFECPAINEITITHPRLRNNIKEGTEKNLRTRVRVWNGILTFGHDMAIAMN